MVIELILNRIIPSLKKLSPSEYMKSRIYKSCVICESDLSRNNPETKKKVPDNLCFDDLIRFFNLPICNEIGIDFYKIAIGLRNNKFNLEQFVKEPTLYMNVGKHKCKECGRISKIIYSSPYCYQCVKDYQKYLIEIALGFIDPENIPDSYIRNTKCPDCGKPLEREGLCCQCQNRYSWENIETDIDRGRIRWEDFISDPDVRSTYR